jgi:rare lipoprotein A
MSRYAAFLLPTVFMLSACSFGVPIGEPTPIPGSGAPETTRSERGNPSSYVVFGKRYRVLNSSEGFRQRGVASWYGTKFHGRPTSSGEVYNMHAMTAAHKTLPIPVYVHVKNLDNGRSIVVRVNDRGPFIDGRIIDLSYAAAKKLGVDGPGTANVEISALSPGESKPSSVVRSIPLIDEPDLNPRLYVQMGSFSNPMNANNLVQNLLNANEASARVSRLQTDNGMFYRVRVGPLFDIDEANAIVRRLKTKGFQTARIVVADATE